jgi:hypothetical protein
MTMRGLDAQAELKLEPFDGVGSGTYAESGSWPTRGEIFDTIVPQPWAASDFWGSDDFDLMSAHGDRHDTIPSPPPELDSSPIHFKF